MQTKDKLIEQISGVSDTQWDALFAFIPVFEKTTDFGSWTESEKLGDGILTIPHCNLSPMVMDFVKQIYASDLILSFDWMRWEEGPKILGDTITDFDLYDKLTLCKFITLIVRNDRFTEGYLLRCFEEGIVLKILRSLERKVLLSRD